MLDKPECEQATFVDNYLAISRQFRDALYTTHPNFDLIVRQCFHLDELKVFNINYTSEMNPDRRLPSQEPSCYTNLSYLSVS